MKAHILLIACPDETGLVHRITGVLYSRGLNIISNGEFVETATNRFFMRTEFAGGDGVELSPRELTEQLAGVIPSTASIRLSRRRRPDLVVLVTKEPHCLGDLLLRHDSGQLRGRLRAVIGNHPHLEPLVQRFGIPYHCVESEGRSREEHEEAVLETAQRYEPEYLVLAKYMRVLSSGFVSHFPNRIVNIHHSFLPAFAGARPYQQAFERGVKIIGATAHFVDENLDEGPIIAQSIIPVDHTSSARDMARAGQDVEKVVLAGALRLVLEDRVFVSGRRTVIFD